MSRQGAHDLLNSIAAALGIESTAANAAGCQWMSWSSDLLVFAILLAWAFLCSNVMSTTEASTIESAHSALLQAAQSVRVTRSSINGNVSKHVLPSTIAFSTINALHEAAKSISGKSNCDFVAVSDNELLFTYVNTFEKSANGKRKRLHAEDDVDGSLKTLEGRVNITDMANAREVLVRLLRDLHGPNQETLVQSIAVAHQKLRMSDAEPRVIIAARLASGIAIPVGKLKNALGKCWDDGALTTDEDSDLLRSFNLPESAEGILSRELGHRSLRMVTAIPNVVAAQTQLSGQS